MEYIIWYRFLISFLSFNIVAQLSYYLSEEYMDDEDNGDDALGQYLENVGKRLLDIRSISNEINRQQAWKYIGEEMIL